ncbi:MAG: GntR family transcriptional regulator [Acidobacteria bacterium]|nr:GntR family transcriptional regulator [Acidobacteriota bacterium]
MTIWIPVLPQNDTPIYRRIADQLERDVSRGVLLPGSRLPTHRELAQKLGVTVVTVTRAYSEASHRGLIESAVGRGSFVRPTRTKAAIATEIDFAMNVVAGDFTLGAPLADRIAAVLSTPYNVGAGTERHRSAGAAWVADGRPDAAASRIIVTSGAQQGILLAFAALTKPGDAILCEALTYHGAKAAAAMLHLRVEPVAIDRWGLDPEALGKALRKRNAPKVLYMLPTLQNPTGTLMPDKRRREIAALADKHGVTIVEDDVYRFLTVNAPKAVTSYVPERGIYIAGVGKCLAPALRTGYLLAPPALVPRIQQALAASSLFASPFGAEIAATAIEDGSAARAAAQKREAIAVRRRIATRVLGRLAGQADPQSPHLFLELPPHWSADAFAAEARQRRVHVTNAELFATGPDSPAAVRLCLGAPPTAAEVETGLNVLSSLLERDDRHTATVV